MAASRHECSICMDSFKNPKLISCHHSFCYKCLEDYVQVNLHNGRFNCPICRTSVTLPDRGILGFQSNFYIDTDYNEKFPCEICGPKSMAYSRCLDCDENLCQTCCYVHEKSKGTRHHKISDLVTLGSEMKGKIRQRVFCDQHPQEEIKLVCQDCKVTICFMCKAVKHDTHPTKSLADVVAEVKMTLDTKLNRCSDKLRRIKASTVKGEELDRSMNDAEQEELKAVDDQCSQLHKAIDQEAAKFKDKIKNVYRLLKEQNAVFRNCMQEEFKLCSNTKEIAQNLRDKGTDIEIIKKGPDIEQLISAALVKTDLPTPTIRLNNKLFSPAKIIASKLTPLIGKLQDSTDAEEIPSKEREERERKEKAEREKKDREERRKKEKEEREKKERAEREKKDREDRVRTEREERRKMEREEMSRKKRDERERKEREEREKKEREEMQIKEYRPKGYDEKIKKSKAKFLRKYEVPPRFPQMPGSASDCDGASGDDGQQGKKYVYIDMYRAYCKRNKLPLTDFNTFRIKGSGFVSMITLNGETYGNGEFFPTVKEAEGAAAKLAVQGLGLDRKDVAQEKPVSSTGVCNLSTEALLAIKNRVKQIVIGKINGLWATRLPHEYKVKFGVEAPAGLMDLVKNSFKDICKVELVQHTEREIIYPVLEDHDKCKDLRILQQELLPIGEKITVYLTYMYNCGHFCVQKEDSCIDQITEELQKDCKTKSAPNLELLKIGQFCAGLFSADKCWRRAKINDIKDSEPKIELLFVDYGDVERVLSKDIRWLSEKTAAAPAQCIKCSLHGIQPLETEIRWSSSSAEAFAKIVQDVPLIAVTRTHYDETCDVDLCLVSDPVISISDKLVQQRVVRSIFPVESYLEENEEAGEEEVEEEEVQKEEVDASCPDIDSLACSSYKTVILILVDAMKITFVDMR